MLTITFTGTTDWTCPAGVTTLASVLLYGGGGGGGGGSGPSGQGGAGGGGGGCTIAYNVPVTPGNVYHVGVGVGGYPGAAGTPNGSAAGNGGNGQNTAFPAAAGSIVAYGGTGGPGAHTTGQPVPSGGTGTWPGGEGAYGGGTGGCGGGGAGGTAGAGGYGSPSSGRNPGAGGTGSPDAYAGNGAGGGWGSTGNNGTSGGTGAAYGGGGAGGGGGADAHTWGGGHGGGGLAVLTYLPVTGGGTYTVGGTVTGLTGGTLILADGDGNQVPVTANGAFTFPAVTTGTAYTVTVISAPAGQTATVTSGSGTVGSANITTVTVTCATAATYTVGGTVTGLTGTLVLQNNGTDTLTITASGAFTFPTALVSGAGYNVTVLTVPAGQTVTAGAASGTIAAGNITSVTVTCTTGTGPAVLGPGPLTVTPQPVPGMSVAVSAGYCAVPAPAQGNGVYLFGLTAQASLTVAANPASVARTDIVITKVYDLASASSYADVEIISGTAGAGQPATPAVSILLAAVTVAPSATSITAGNITDLRSFTAAPGGILPATVTTAPPLVAGQVIYDTAAGSLKRLPAPVSFTKTFSATTSWISPITGMVFVSGIGGSGGGGGGYKGTTGTTSGGGGSGGGEWAGQWIAVTTGSSYPVTIGAAGVLGHGSTAPTFAQAGTAGTATTFIGDGGVTLTANGGQGGEGGGAQFPAMGGQGGLGSTSAQHQPGGAGGAGAQAPTAAGGGGGGSGSPGAPGGAGGNAIGATPGLGGTTGPGGGAGGRGGVPTGNGATAIDPGAGAGGGGADDVKDWNAGGRGCNGSLTLSWTVQPATLTAVATTISSDNTTPGQYLNLVNTDIAHGRSPGSGSLYGWGIGYGHTTGTSADGVVATEIQVSFTADGRTDYALDARWGIVIPEAAVDSATPGIPSGRCQIIVMIDNVIIDTVWLNCSATGGVTHPGDSGSFTAWTSTKNGNRPAKGTHTAKLAVKTLSTTSSGYSGAHIGNLASVGASTSTPFGAAVLPAPYLATLVAEMSYLRVSGIASAGT